MRQFVGLVIGIAVGVAGAILFTQSLPPEEGSVEERAEIAEVALHRAEARILQLEADAGITGRRRKSVAEEARSVADDIKAGRPVDLDDVFKTAKPWLRDIAPVFDRIRVRDQKRIFDTTAGELARKYNLDESQQKSLENWLHLKAEENSTNYSRILNDESTGLVDWIRSSRELSEADGLDEFMERTLRGEALTQFKEERLRERVERVQAEADRKVHRLGNIVELDEAQKDEIFVLMARGSRDFDPSMQFEGLGNDTSALVPGQSRDDAIMKVLRPDQVETYERHRLGSLEEARRELNEIGLTLPDNWDLLDEDDF